MTLNIGMDDPLVVVKEKYAILGLYIYIYI